MSYQPDPNWKDNPLATNQWAKIPTADFPTEEKALEWMDAQKPGRPMKPVTTRYLSGKVVWRVAAQQWH